MHTPGAQVSKYMNPAAKICTQGAGCTINFEHYIYIYIYIYGYMDIYIYIYYIYECTYIQASTFKVLVCVCMCVCTSTVKTCNVPLEIRLVFSQVR